MSVEGLIRVMPPDVAYCKACFDGAYLVGKPEGFTKNIHEG